MGRPFYPTEVDDPDLDWLVSNFLYERPDYIPVESGPLPLMLMPYTDEKQPEAACSVDVAESEEPAPIRQKHA